MLDLTKRAPFASGVGCVLSDAARQRECPLKPWVVSAVSIGRSGLPSMQTRWRGFGAYREGGGVGGGRLQRDGTRYRFRLDAGGTLLSCRVIHQRRSLGIRGLLSTRLGSHGRRQTIPQGAPITLRSGTRLGRLTTGCRSSRSSQESRSGVTRTFPDGLTGSQGFYISWRCSRL